MNSSNAKLLQEQVDYYKDWVKEYDDMMPFIISSSC